MQKELKIKEQKKNQHIKLQNIIPNKIENLLHKPIENLTKTEFNQIIESIDFSKITLKISEKLKDIALKKPEFFNPEHIELFLFYFDKNEDILKDIDKNEKISKIADNFEGIITHIILNNKNTIKGIPNIIDRIENSNNKIYLTSIIKNIAEENPNLLSIENILKISNLFKISFKKEQSINDSIYTGTLKSIIKHCSEVHEQYIQIWKDLLIFELEATEKNTKNILKELLVIAKKDPEIFNGEDILRIHSLSGRDFYPKNKDERLINLITEFFETIINTKGMNEIWERLFEDLNTLNVEIFKSSEIFKKYILNNLFPFRTLSNVKFEHISDIYRLIELSKRPNGDGIVSTLSVENNISFFGRYSINTLEYLYSNFRKKPSKNQKTALWIFPKEDDNHAFYYDNKFIDEIIKNNYHISIIEVGNEREFKDWSLLMERKNGKNFDVLVLSGHGTIESIQLGKGESEKEQIDLEDDFEIKLIGKLVKKEGIIILNSCSTASEEKTTSIAKKIFEENKIHLIAPETPTSIDTFHFDEKGDLIGVEYIKEKDGTDPKKEFKIE